MSYYRDIVIQTYRNPGELSNKPIRARPVPGQGFSPGLNVECSSTMRESYPVGTLMIIKVKITDREGTPYLYTRYSWDYKVVTPAQATRFIREHYGNHA